MTRCGLGDVQQGAVTDDYQVEVGDGVLQTSTPSCRSQRPRVSATAGALLVPGISATRWDVELPGDAERAWRRSSFHLPQFLGAQHRRLDDVHDDAVEPHLSRTCRAVMAVPGRGHLAAQGRRMLAAFAQQLDRATWSSAGQVSRIASVSPSSPRRRPAPRRRRRHRPGRNCSGR